MSINFNVPPYFDDFESVSEFDGSDGLSPKDKYHKLLFRPSYAVQARELTQLQSVLQNQITNLGHHLFVEGSLVIPGDVSFSNDIDYIKVEMGSIPDVNADINYIMSNLDDSDSTGLKGKYLVRAIDLDLTGNITLPEPTLSAKILKVVPAIGTAPAVLYIQYYAASAEKTVDTGVNVNVNKFRPSDELKVIDKMPSVYGSNSNSNPSPTSLTLQFHQAVLKIPSELKQSAIGKASLAFVEKGVYFIKGNFVQVQNSTLIVAPFSTSASADIGFRIKESVISSAEDPTLSDNATGSPNFAAPGAHRYEIKTELIALDINTDIEGTDDDFLLLCRVDESAVKWKVKRTDYNIIEDEFARRTFDESGNYTVRPFHIDITEDRDNVDLFQAQLEPSKAYVQGYEIETLSSISVPIEKARRAEDTDAKESVTVSIGVGNYILVSPRDFSSLLSSGIVPPIDTFARVDLKNFDNSTIGYTRIRSVTRVSPGYTHDDQGVIIRDTSLDIYKVYLFDVFLNEFQNFSSVASLLYSSNNHTFDVKLVSTPAVIKETDKNSLVYKLPYDRVKTCSIAKLNTTEEADYNYRFRTIKMFSPKHGNGNFINATVNNTETESFGAFNQSDWILEKFIQSAGTTIIPLTSAMVGAAVSGDMTSIAIDLSSWSGVVGGGKYRLTAPVDSTAIHRTKEVRDIESERWVYDQYVTADSTAYNSAHHYDVITLAKNDVFKINFVKEYIGDGDLGETGTAIYIQNNPEQFKDITEHYILDTGMTDNYYDNSKLRLRSDSDYIPSNDIFCSYKYFHHYPGDFFSIDSYPPEMYDDIPVFNSDNQGKLIELRSSIDFRQSKDIESNVGTCPHPNSKFQTDLEYYLPRKDIIVVDAKGDFRCIKGVSSLTPTLPETPSNSMVLYNLHLQAYTFTPSEIQYEMIDNKRYTMRDIGKIQKRVDNLEYYTSLSLLESEASNKIVVDSEGFLRSKAGFVVDSFKNHSIGNTLSPEYRCAIDRKRRTIRPIFHENSIGLQYVPPTSEINPAVSSHVQKTGDLITLPWSPVELFSQGKASSTININPYDVFTWTGSVKLSPSQDDWKDTTHVPELIVNQTGIYDAMMSIIDATDALGTDWNEWETTFFGSESTSWVSASGRNWQTTTTETNTTEDQARDGILTVNNPFVNYTELGERVIEIGFAPFIRGRRVSFSAERLKPNTIIYPFIDNVNISEYAIRDNVFVDYSSSDDEIFNQMVENYGAHPFDTERLSPMFYPDKQDSVTGKGTHPYRYDANSLETIAWKLYGLNDAPTYDNMSNMYPNTELKTDAAGRLTGSFWFPNDDGLRFKTGTRTFRLSDSPISVNRDEETTFAQTQYHAKGLLETKENLTIATKLPMLSQTQVFDERTIYNTSRTNSTRWWDPLAQSFLIDIDKQPQGAFITSIDLYFAKISETIPVVLQIREVIVGLPSAIIVPHSTVTLYPSDINVDSNLGQAATKFEFESPVYLGSGKSYAFVIFADTIDYEVWMARTQEIDVVTDAAISKNVFAGVLFKSQNGSTWSPDHNADLKFAIHRAKYDISRPGNLVLVNKELPLKRLRNHPFTTTETNELKVYHKNHGFVESSSRQSYVSFSGIERNHPTESPETANLYGIDANKINAISEHPYYDGSNLVSPTGAGVFPVFDVTQDAYSVRLGIDENNSDGRTQFGIGGGKTIEASENYAFSTWYHHAAIVNLPTTNITWGVKTTNLGTIGANNTTVYRKSTNYKAYVPNTNIHEPFPQVITSRENQLHNVDVHDNLPNKSFEVMGQLTSNSDYVSPSVDIERCSVVCIQNRIGNFTGYGELTSVNFNPTTPELTGLGRFNAGLYKFAIDSNNEAKGGILNLSIEGKGPILSIDHFISASNKTLFETDKDYLMIIENPSSSDATNENVGVMKLKINKSDSGAVVFNDIKLSSASTPIAEYVPGVYDFTILDNKSRFGEATPDASGPGPYGYVNFNSGSMDVEYAAKIRVRVDAATSTIAWTDEDNNTVADNIKVLDNGSSDNKFPIGTGVAQPATITQDISYSQAQKLGILFDSDKAYAQDETTIIFASGKSIAYKRNGSSLNTKNLHPTEPQYWDQVPGQGVLINVTASNTLFKNTPSSTGVGAKFKIKDSGSGIVSGEYVADVEQVNVYNILPIPHGSTTVLLREYTPYNENLMGTNEKVSLLVNPNATADEEGNFDWTFNLKVIVNYLYSGASGASKSVGFNINGISMSAFKDILKDDLGLDSIPALSGTYPNASYNTYAFKEVANNQSDTLTTWLNDLVVDRWRSIQAWAILLTGSVDLSDSSNLTGDGGYIDPTLSNGVAGDILNIHIANVNDPSTLQLSSTGTSISMSTDSNSSKIGIFLEDTWSTAAHGTTDLIYWNLSPDGPYESILTDYSGTPDIMTLWAGGTDVRIVLNVCQGTPSADNGWDNADAEHEAGKVKITVKSDASLEGAALLNEIQTNAWSNVMGYNVVPLDSDTNKWSFDINQWKHVNGGDTHTVTLKPPEAVTVDLAEVGIWVDPYLELGKMEQDLGNESNPSDNNMLQPVKWRWGYDKSYNPTINYTQIDGDFDDSFTSLIPNGYYYNCMIPAYNVVPLYQASDITPFFNTHAQHSNSVYTGPTGIPINVPITKSTLGLGKKVNNIDTEANWLKGLLKYSFNQQLQHYTFTKYVPSSTRVVTQEDFTNGAEYIEKTYSATNATTETTTTIPITDWQNGVTRTVQSYEYDYSPASISEGDIVYYQDTDEKTFSFYECITSHGDTSIDNNLIDGLLNENTHWQTVYDYNIVLNFLNYNLITYTVVPVEGKFLAYDKLKVRKAPTSSNLSYESKEVNVQRLNYSFSSEGSLATPTFSGLSPTSEKLLQLEYNGQLDTGGSNWNTERFSNDAIAANDIFANPSIIKIQLKNSHLPSHHRLRKIVASPGVPDYNIIINDKVTVYADAVEDTEMPTLYYQEGMFFLESPDNSNKLTSENRIDFLPPQSPYTAKTTGLPADYNSCFSLHTNGESASSAFNTQTNRAAFTGDAYGIAKNLKNNNSSDFLINEGDNRIPDLHESGTIKLSPLEGIEGNITRDGSIVHSINRPNDVMINAVNYTKEDCRLYDNGLRVNLHPYITNFALRSFFLELKTSSLINHVEDWRANHADIAGWEGLVDNEYYRYNIDSEYYNNKITGILGSLAAKIIFPKLDDNVDSGTINHYRSDEGSIIGDVAIEENSEQTNIEWMAVSSNFVIPDAILSCTGTMQFWDKADSTAPDTITTVDGYWPRKGDNYSNIHSGRQIESSKYLFDWNKLKDDAANINIKWNTHQYIEGLYNQPGLLPNDRKLLRREFPYNYNILQNINSTTNPVDYSQTRYSEVDNLDKLMLSAYSTLGSGVYGPPTTGSGRAWTFGDQASTTSVVFNDIVKIDPLTSCTSISYVNGPLSMVTSSDGSETSIRIKIPHNKIHKWVHMALANQSIANNTVTTAFDANNSSILHRQLHNPEMFNFNSFFTFESSTESSTITSKLIYLNDGMRASDGLSSEFNVISGTATIGVEYRIWYPNDSTGVSGFKTYDYPDWYENSGWGVDDNIIVEFLIPSTPGADFINSLVSVSFTHYQNLHVVAPTSTGASIADSSSQACGFGARSIISSSTASTNTTLTDQSDYHGKFKDGNGLSWTDEKYKLEEYRLSDNATDSDIKDNTTTLLYLPVDSGAILKTINQFSGVSTLKFTEIGSNPYEYFTGIITNIQLSPAKTGFGYTTATAVDSGGAQIQIKPNWGNMISSGTAAPKISFTASNTGAVSIFEVYKPDNASSGNIVSGQDSMGYWVGQNYNIGEFDDRHLSVNWHSIYDVKNAANTGLKFTTDSATEKSLPSLQFSADGTNGKISKITRNTPANGVDSSFYVWNQSASNSSGTFGLGIWGLTLSLDDNTSKTIRNSGVTNPDFEVGESSIGASISAVHILKTGYGYAGNISTSSALTLNSYMDSIALQKILSFEDAVAQGMILNSSTITNVTWDAGTWLNTIGSYDLVDIQFISDVAPIVKSNVAALNNVELELLYDGGQDAVFTNNGSSFFEAIDGNRHITFVSYSDSGYSDDRIRNIRDNISNIAQDSRTTMETNYLGWYSDPEKAGLQDTARLFSWGSENSVYNNVTIKSIFQNDLSFLQLVDNVSGVLDSNSDVWLEASGNAYSSNNITLTPIGGNSTSDHTALAEHLKDFITLDFNYIDNTDDVNNLSTRFIAELHPSKGTALNKYVTRNIKLKNSSNLLNIFLDVNRPFGTDIEVYYRTHTEDDMIDESNWILGEPVGGTDIPFNDNPNVFTETEYYIDNVISANNMFTTFAIKIVFKSANSSVIPQVRDLRAIALNV